MVRFTPPLLVAQLVAAIVGFAPLPAVGGSAQLVSFSVDVPGLCAGPGGTGAASLYRLARALVSSAGIPIEVVDWNDAGIAYADYARTVSVDVCAYPNDPHVKSKCTDKVKNSVGDLVEMVRVKFNQATSGHNDADAFDILVKKQLVHFQRIQTLSAIAKATHPDFQCRTDVDPALDCVQDSRPPAQRAIPIPAQVFSATPLFAATCVPTKTEAAVFVASPPATSAAAPALSGNATPAGSVNSAAATPDQSVSMPPVAAAAEPNPTGWLTAVRLRGKPGDLPIDRSSTDFSGIGGATLAISDDQISNKYTFDIHAVVGYALPSYHYQNTFYLDSIPFVAYDRDYVEATKTPANSNIENLTLGLQESLTFGAGSFYHNLTVQPEYIRSLRYDSDIVKLHSSYQPEPLLGIIGYPAALGDTGFMLSAYGRVPFNVGQVLHAGDQPTLAQTNTFVQAGFTVGGSLFATDSSWLKGFSLPVEYTYLRGFAGQYKDIRLLQASLNYTLPQIKYVTIGVSYTNGRDLDTFVMQNIYKVSLGLKY